MLNQFINNSSDEELLKSLVGDEVHVDQEELEKAMNKAGLVQKEVQVHTQHGVHTRKQWVKASDEQPKQDASELEQKQKEFYKKYPTGMQNPEDCLRANGSHATWRGEKLQNPKVMANAKKEYAQYLKDKKELESLKESSSKKDDGFKSEEKPAIDSKTTAISPSELKVGDYVKYVGTGEDKGVTAVVKITEITTFNAKGHIVYTINRSGRYRMACRDDKTIEKYNASKDNDISGKSDTKVKYSKEDKDDAFRKYSKILLKYADKSSDATIGDVGKVIGEIEELNKNGGLYKKDYDTLSKYMAMAQKASRSRTSTQHDKGINSGLELIDYNGETIRKVQRTIKGETKDYYRVDGSRTLYEDIEDAKKEIDEMPGKTVGGATKDKDGNIHIDIPQNGYKGSSKKPSDMSDEELGSAIKSKAKEISEVLKDGNPTGKMKEKYDKLVEESKDLQQEQTKRMKTASTTTSTKLSKDEAKKKTQSITSSIGKDEEKRKDFMDKAKAQGITWKENEHVGINWMRCCMALNSHFENGGSWDENNDSNTTPSSSINLESELESGKPELIIYKKSLENDNWAMVQTIADKAGYSVERCDKSGHVGSYMDATNTHYKFTKKASGTSKETKQITDKQEFIKEMVKNYGSMSRSDLKSAVKEFCTANDFDEDKVLKKIDEQAKNN